MAPSTPWPALSLPSPGARGGCVLGQASLLAPSSLVSSVRVAPGDAPLLLLRQTLSFSISQAGNPECRWLSHSALLDSLLGETLSWSLGSLGNRAGSRRTRGHRCGPSTGIAPVRGRQSQQLCPVRELPGLGMHAMGRPRVPAAPRPAEPCPLLGGRRERRAGHTHEDAECGGRPCPQLSRPPLPRSQDAPRQRLCPGLCQHLLA